MRRRRRRMTCRSRGEEKRREAVLREAAVLNARLKEASGHVGRLADAPPKGGAKDGAALAGKFAQLGGERHTLLFTQSKKVGHER